MRILEDGGYILPYSAEVMFIGQIGTDLEQTGAVYAEPHVSGRIRHHVTHLYARHRKVLQFARNCDKFLGPDIETIQMIVIGGDP